MRKHVLVVDDDPMILEIIERALACDDVRITTVRRVSLARDVLARQTVDLVITDARIPGETGIQLAHDTGERGIAAIVMSGDPEWLEQHGVLPAHYLAKPFDLRYLQRLVAAHLEQDSGDWDREIIPPAPIP